MNLEIIEIRNEKFDINFINNLYEIHNKVFLDNDKMTFENFANEFNLSNRIYFFCRDLNELVGYIGAINCVDSLEIIGIGVKQPYQNLGIGSKLLEKLFDKAKELEINKIFLEVDEKNIKAQNFYKKNGFLITNIRKKYYKDSDALIMMRTLF